MTKKHSCKTRRKVFRQYLIFDMILSSLTSLFAGAVIAAVFFACRPITHSSVLMFIDKGVDLFIATAISWGFTAFINRRKHRQKYTILFLNELQLILSSVENSASALDRVRVIEKALFCLTELKTFARSRQNKSILRLEELLSELALLTQSDNSDKYKTSLTTAKQYLNHLIKLLAP